MRRMSLRALAALLASLVLAMTTPATHADSSSRELASYYERHMALAGDVAYGWVGRGEPQRMKAGVVQEVTDWHARSIADLGFVVQERVNVAMSSRLPGVNSHLRVGHETILVAMLQTDRAAVEGR